ncbi:MAG: DUF1295 domain-containing protein [Pseudomonadales bacterium]|jgi:steroid 5-alpha reductase family enzyme|nr:DUF1295 domain-containing protein [Gammaproteobacteria bacterium]MBK6583648.1 DUF1295 domain-containing protein [Gammaproteobacteria bacterium]MBK7169846.1 DUF1295 domain-containing protein [Gammaproteobacteria bacterium]MBP6050433.1 DUF1295 domain-containing protein [Pseudomonadales bacterium]MBP6228047.1 DUF1295 domain-containing protein [Pseudomonadales bacterium]
MAAILSSLSLSATAVLCSVLALWLLSIRLRDVSIIDLAYGLLIGAVALLGFLRSDSRGELQYLALAAITIWMTRYTLHVFRRNIGKGEDPRYTRLRGWVGSERAFRWFSLRQVFLHQGVVIWLISLPLQLIMCGPATAAGILAYAGLLLWGAGFITEAVADRQLTRFRNNPAQRGQILDTGLWRYSRHPNYFGDACVHWGIYLMACSVPWGAATIIGPVAITHYLLNVTGMRTLEKKMLREKPAYADYVKRTSGFVPLPPLRNARLRADRS